MPLEKPLDDVKAADLTALIEGSVEERKVIEYKRELPGRADEAKREFLADVASFPNTAGGHLIYGITEEEGVPTEVAGVEVENVDEQKQWFENTIRDGIAPRVPGVGVHQVPLDGGRVVFVLRLPRSWLSPHMVTFRNLSRFYARNSAGKYQLDVGEIRSAMLAAPLASDRVRAFRADRVAAVQAEKGTARLVETPKIVLHLIPLDAFDAGRPPLDLTPFYHDRRLRPMYLEELYRRRWNIDGLLTDDQRDDEPPHSYLQLFRSGIIESVEGWFIRPREIQGREVRVVLGYEFERIVGDETRRFLDMQGYAGVQPPVVALLTLLGVSGWGILGNDDERLRDRYGVVIDRDPLLLPEIIFDPLDLDTHATLRPAFDAFWQAGGRPRSPNYDDEGLWRRRER